MSKFNEDDLRAALGESLVQIAELQAEHPDAGAMDNLKEDLAHCVDSNKGLAKQSLDRGATIRDQATEITELKKEREEVVARMTLTWQQVTQENTELKTQIKFLQEQIKHP